MLTMNTCHRPVFFEMLFVTLPVICFGGIVSDASLPSISNSACHFRKDIRFGGVLVDCQGLGLTSLPPSNWIPSSTTSLLLQSNSITRLENVSLVDAPNLRYISLAYNKLDYVDPLAFGFNKKIQTVDLENNKINLSNESIPSSIFRGVDDLVELRLGHNENEDVSFSYYSPDLLRGMKSLQKLSLDTFYTDLDFNGIFKHTMSLISLELTGGATSIPNDTFIDFDQIRLGELRIFQTVHLTSTDIRSFSHLPYLDKLTIELTSLGVEPVLESMYPFDGKNMTSITLAGFVRDRGNAERFKKNIEVTKHMARYLTRICVSTFTLASYYIFFIDADVITNPLWRNCLVNLDVSDNPLLGDVMELPRLKYMRLLNSFRMKNRKYSFLDKRDRVNSETLQQLDGNALGLDYSHRSNDLDRTMDVWNSVDVQSVGNTSSGNNTSGTVKHVTRQDIKSSPRGVVLKHFTYLNLQGFSGNVGPLHIKFKLQWAHNLKEIHCSDMGLRQLTGALPGLENVETFDFSRNDGSEMTRSFLGSFPNAKTVNLSAMNLGRVLTLEINRNIFQVFPHLESLDLSKNDIYFLQENVFTDNPNLRYIGLSGNHLKSIPFNIGHLANLHTLDLRSNSFLSLSVSETSALDRQASRVGSFKVLLDGNLFSCSCSNIVFLQWLQLTWTNMDKFRNFSCLLENGHISSTSETRDIAAFWRICHGKTSFYASLVLLCLLGLAFSLFYFGVKFQIQLKAAVYQFFSEHFAPKTPRDYHHGVYIGYADSDSDFVCTQLRDLIERDFRLTAFIRHRDLLPATSMAEMGSLIHSSWRVLLVATPEFLEDSWSEYVMKTAVLGVQADNPGRLVLVFFSEEDVCSVPRDVLDVVKEESAILLTTRDSFTEQQMLKLRRALLDG